MLIVSSVLFLLSVFDIAEVKCDIFTNPFSLRELFLAEGRLVEAMREYGLQLQKSELKKKIDRYLSDHQLILDELPPLHPLSSANPDNYEDPLMTEVVGNPIHVFRLCMRVTKELTDITSKAKDENMIPEKKDFLEAVEVEKLDTVWCSEADLTGTSLSLARIQTFYMLDAVDMAKGKIGGKVTRARLGVSDCVFLAEDRLTGMGKVADGSGPEIALAIEWMEAAYQLSMDQKQETKLTQAIRKSLLELRRQHDQAFQPMHPGNGPSRHPSEYFFLRKIGQDLNLTARQLRMEEDKMFVEERFSIQFEGFNYNNRDFAHLCRGLKLKRPGTTVKFGNQCFLSDKGDPYLKLMPIKVEVLTEVPMMHMYHGVVSDKDADYIKRQARTQFQQAAIEDRSVKQPGANMISYLRTQSVGWLSDSHSSQLETVAKKLSRATGLEVARNTYFSTVIDPYVTFESEQFQVGIYGPGGLYLPHIDTLDNDPAIFAHGNIWVGNRMSTAMIYLSDNLGGGGTAFPQVGVAAFPKKGSVVFWHSLTMDGRKDPISMHGACPTMYGIKWVANKWIREGCQMFKRPCGLTKNEGVISSILLN